MDGSRVVSFCDLFAEPLRNGVFKPKAVRGDGTKMVNMGEVFAHRRIKAINMDRVPLTDRERASSLLEAGDLLFARASLVLSGVGKCCLYEGDNEPVTFESHIIRCRLNRDLAEPAFYFYFFESRVGRSLIESIAEQVAAAGIRGSDLATLRLPLPPLPEQKRIAHILGTLDDKIELNRRMNATLEAMSRAIFKSWFVDFDPVRQKAAGKQPVGMDAETAAMFPDSFEDSELGEVPRGWRGKTIRDVLFLSRESLNPADQPEEIFAHYSLPAFDSGQWPADDLGSDIKSQKFIVPAGSVLISKLNPKTPRVWLPQQGISRRSIASTEFLVCMPNKAIGASASFVYCVGANTDFIDYLTSLASGTSNSHQRVRPNDFLDYTIALPASKVLIAFDKTIGPVLDEVRGARKQSRTLAALRDTLLPKLLSGEIRVPEAEEAVEEAVG